MRTLGGAVVVLGALCGIAFAVVFVSKVRSGEAFGYAVMASLLLGAVAGIQLGRVMLRPSQAGL